MKKTIYGSVGLVLSLSLLACTSAPDYAGSRSSVSTPAQAEDDVYSEDVKAEPGVKQVEEESSANPFVGCGYSSLDEGDAADIGAHNLKSTPSQAKGEKATIFGNGTINLSGSLGAFKTINAFQVTSASPNNAKGKAEDFAKKASSTTEYSALSQQDVQAALSAGADRPLCGFLMANALSSTSVDGKTYMKVSFDKPVVFLMNPLLSPERLKLELAKPIKIENVTATIDSNEKEVTKAGTTRRGQVEISLINPNRKIIDSMGLNTSIKSEVAYRVANKFDPSGEGDDKTITQLNQVTDYYISGNRITHVVINTPRFELPIIVYTE